MDIGQALTLGIVQGLTEFLPVSSSAHLRLVPALLGWPDPGAAYSAIIQLGTTAAVLVYFAKDLWGIAWGFCRALLARKPLESFEARLGWAILVGTLPVGVAGLAFKDLIEREARSLWVVAVTSIVMGLLLLAAERLARHLRDFSTVGLSDGVWVGLAQALALVPGTSRSGITLTAGLFLDLKRDAAARFSFLLSVPATVAAALFELRHLSHARAAGEPLAPAALAAGTVSSFVFGLLAIAFLLRLLRTRTTLGFVVYRLLLGTAVLLLLWRGVLSP